MKKRKFKFFKSGTLLLLLSVLLIGARLEAQVIPPTGKPGITALPPAAEIGLNKSIVPIEIPIEFIDLKNYTVTKTSNSTLIFDSSTPYFKELTIVDSRNIELQGVLVFYDTPSYVNATQKIFDFTNVTSGIYYAKGVVTGAPVYYKIIVK